MLRSAVAVEDPGPALGSGLREETTGQDLTSFSTTLRPRDSRSQAVGVFPLKGETELGCSPRLVVAGYRMQSECCRKDLEQACKPDDA